MDPFSVTAKEKVRRLDSLMNELVSTIENVRQDIRASVRWLTVCDLPDEVIVPIFQPVCTSSSSLINLSLVCKRFRQIALSSSKLWSGCTLTLSMPRNIIDMVASRSGSSGLTVVLEGTYHRLTKHQNRVSKLFEHSAQWKELTAVMDDLALRHISALFPNLSALVKLDVSARLTGDSHRLPSFYQNWSLPSLRILTDPTWIPPPSFASKVPKLIECHLSPEPSEFSQLIVFLNAVPDLQILRLTMEDFDDTSMDESTMTLNVPALRRLRLTFRPSWIQSTIEHILPILLGPGLTNLALRFHDRTQEGTDITILNCKRGLPSLRTLCPCLENFTLAIYGYAGRKKLYFIDDILHHLPCTIKSIFVRLGGDIQLLSHDQNSFSEVSESTHPFFTSFSVKHKKCFSQDFFPQVAAQFKLRKIKLKEVSYIHDENMMKDTRNIFREAGVL